MLLTMSILEHPIAKQGASEGLPIYFLRLGQDPTIIARVLVTLMVSLLP